MPTVMITGASDGIGRELAELYFNKGYTVIATGRRERRDVKRPIPEAVKYVSCDLTEGLEPLLAALPDRLDVAILNAGLGKVAKVADHSAAEISTMVAVNTTAPLLLAHALFDRLQGGTLAFIGSTAVRGGHGDFSVYAATKAALSGASRSLELEWEGKVKVLTIHPGPTRTDMHDKAGLPQIATRKLFTDPAIVASSIAPAIDKGRGKRLGMGYTLRHAVLGSRR